jgi:hypothetical protein
MRATIVPTFKVNDIVTAKGHDQRHRGTVTVANPGGHVLVHWHGDDRLTIESPDELVRVGTSITVTFNDEHEAGALLAWVDSNLYEVNRNVRQAERDGDRQFLANSRVEQKGLGATEAALRAAGIEKFVGLEDGPS